MSSYFLDTVYPALKIALNTVGLVSAMLVVSVMACLRYFCPALVNRVSLRIQWAIACVDVMKHVLFYFITAPASPAVCSMIGFFTCFLDQIYFMLNASIVANMQLMFVQDKFPQPSWELRYWLASFSIATSVTVPPLGNSL
ncbi:hypothetical protein DSO57_1028873 [Entomophthora muscae]|uniref:Uncharacterized protein n=1 Tax=Entomophthora muscae TaxID=34485 RepID=A0ACC2RG01_9FUNG|nr:hypothetical protein DSO57_1028873 [Entomophthora muscae]